MKDGFSIAWLQNLLNTVWADNNLYTRVVTTNRQTEALAWVIFVFFVDLIIINTLEEN